MLICNVMSLFNWSFPPERDGLPASAALLETRAALKSRSPLYSDDPEVERRDITLGGVACLELVPPRESRCTILYFHGGGFRLGSASTWSGFGTRLAKATRARVILPDYRLAPENPFPAALHDAATLCEAIGDVDGGLFLAGDSAGGGLAVAVTAAARIANLPPPAGLVLMSPWLDLTLTSDTFSTRETRDKMFTLENACSAMGAYLQGHDPCDPLASPLFADLASLPPSIIMAGSEETLLGDTLQFGEKMGQAGSSVSMHILAGMQHVWPVIQPDLPETEQVFALIASFVADRLDADQHAQSTTTP